MKKSDTPKKKMDTRSLAPNTGSDPDRRNG